MNIQLISSFFKRKVRDTGSLAVVLAPYGIYLAQVVFAGAMPRVVRCEYHETGEVTASALEHLMRQLGLSGADCISLLAPSVYQMLVVEAPNVPINEMKAAIRWKIKDSLSYHVEDATTDVLMIPAQKYGTLHAQSLYAIAVPNQTIQQHVALFEKAKLRLSVIDIQETAQRNVAALFEQGEKALAILVFDELGGLLTFTAGGELYLARRIDITLGQLRDADVNLRREFYERAELELQRSMDYFERQFNHMDVSRVLIGVPDDVDLLGLLKGSVEVAVEHLDLSQVMDISAIPLLADREFVLHALPALGAALRHESRVL